MFFDIYCDLCRGRNVSPSAAAIEMGINKGTVSVWKNKGTTPQTAQLQKIADYFDVSVDYLLTGEETEKAASSQADDLSFDDFTYAMYGESKELTEEDKALLLSMAKQLKEARKKKD